MSWKGPRPPGEPSPPYKGSGSSKKKLTKKGKEIRDKVSDSLLDKKFKKNFPHITFRLNNKIDPDLKQYIFNACNIFKENFPKVFKKIKFIGVGIPKELPEDYSTNSNAYAQAIGFKYISLNTKYFGSKYDLSKQYHIDVYNGFHPKTKFPACVAILLHEMSHVLYNNIPFMYTQTISNNYNKKFLFVGGTKDDIKYDVSSYALKDDEEFFAEAMVRIMDGQRNKTLDEVNRIVTKWKKEGGKIAK